jgi:hypothetical protein
MSVDGIERKTQRIPIRITRDEAKYINHMARALGYDSFRDYAIAIAGTIIERLCDDFEEQLEVNTPVDIPVIEMIARKQARDKTLKVLGELDNKITSR